MGVTGSRSCNGCHALHPIIIVTQKKTGDTQKPADEPISRFTHLRKREDTFFPPSFIPPVPYPARSARNLPLEGKALIQEKHHTFPFYWKEGKTELGHCPIYTPRHFIIFCAALPPFEPLEPIEPAEPLSHTIKGRYAPWTNPEQIKTALRGQAAQSGF